MGTVIYSSLFQIERKSLCISDRNIPPPTWSISAKFNRYLAIYTFLILQLQCETYKN
jgi:hypothetical protein